MSGAAKTSTAMEIACTRYCIYVDASDFPSYGYTLLYHTDEGMQEDMVKKSLKIKYHILSRGLQTICIILSTLPIIIIPSWACFLCNWVAFCTD